MILDSFCHSPRGPASSHLGIAPNKPSDSEKSHKDLFLIRNPIVSKLISESLNREISNRASFGYGGGLKRGNNTEDVQSPEKSDCALVSRGNISAPYSLCYMHYYLMHNFYGLRLEMLKAQVFHVRNHINVILTAKVGFPY